MKSFESIGAFREYMLKIAIAEEIAIRKGLSKAAKVVQKEAKAEIGNYQDEVGEFVAWPELADATKEDRLRHGYSENDPLLRTGDLRESIEVAMSLSGLEAQIGSNSDIAVYQELGTDHIPPRSFLGGAMTRKLPEVREILGASVVAGLVGGQVFEGTMLIEDSDV